MKAVTRKARITRTTGQALIEFALILPLLIVMIFAIIDFGYYLFVTISVNHATRAGVRTAAMNNASCAQIKNVVLQNAVGVDLKAKDVTVAPTPKDAQLPGNPPTVTVAVNYTHTMFAPSLWQFSTLPVRSTFKGIVTTYTGREEISFTCP